MGIAHVLEALERLEHVVLEDQDALVLVLLLYFEGDVLLKEVVKCLIDEAKCSLPELVLDIEALGDPQGLLDWVSLRNQTRRWTHLPDNWWSHMRFRPMRHTLGLMCITRAACHHVRGSSCNRLILVAVHGLHDLVASNCRDLRLRLVHVSLAEADQFHRLLGLLGVGSG